MDMHWCQGTQNIGLFNHKLKSALTYTVWSQYTPVPNGQTDRRTNIMAIARRFILTNASRANNNNVINSLAVSSKFALGSTTSFRVEIWGHGLVLVRCVSVWSEINSLMYAAVLGSVAIRHRAINHREIRSPVIRQTAPFNGDVHRHCGHVRSVRRRNGRNCSRHPRASCRSSSLVNNGNDTMRALGACERIGDFMSEPSIRRPLE